MAKIDAQVMDLAKDFLEHSDNDVTKFMKKYQSIIDGYETSIFKNYVIFKIYFDEDLINDVNEYIQLFKMKQNNEEYDKKRFNEVRKETNYYYSILKELDDYNIDLNAEGYEFEKESYEKFGIYYRLNDGMDNTISNQTILRQLTNGVSYICDGDYTMLRNLIYGDHDTDFEVYGDVEVPFYVTKGSSEISFKDGYNEYVKRIEADYDEE